METESLDYSIEKSKKKDTTKKDKLQNTNLLKDMNINEQDIERRKEWLEFTEKDVKHLAELNNIAKGYADELVKSLNDHFKNSMSLAKYSIIQKYCNESRYYKRNTSLD